MSMHRQRARAVRSALESLESRRLLAAVARGVDVDGDVWVLRLTGPGDLRVVQQSDANGNVIPLGRPAFIDSITISGTDPQSSRLVGTVRKAPNGDGRVFFASLDQLGGVSKAFAGANLGTNTVDMPQFWLGQTSSISTAPDPSISMPFGVNVLRFGGVDVTFAPSGITPPDQNGQADNFTVNLGLPFTYGTSIIVDRVLSSAQPGANNQAPVQDSVTFTVDGRINTFQARTIQGNAAVPSTGFANGGGTLVRSIVASDQGVTGQIGNVQIAGDATNFGVQTNDRVKQFYIAGETRNVSILAPEGVENVMFGLGMDTVTIRARKIDSLQANRGAVSSDVTATDTIGRITIGGDVVNTNVFAGYEQNLATVFQTQQAPISMPPAKSTGAINNVLIAGDVINSIFAAAVEPFEGQFDVSEALRFPHSHISAKVEGTIMNQVVTPNKPDQAFYAKTISVGHGPVNPPNVPASIPNPNGKPHGHRVYKHLQTWRQQTVASPQGPRGAG
jgi:hypothetical protein